MFSDDDLMNIVESENLIDTMFISMNEDLGDTIKAAIGSPIKYVKLKNNLKQYGKFKLDAASVDMDTIRKKEAAKKDPEGFDKEKLETAQKAKKDAIKGKIIAVEDRISQLTTSDALKALARLGKSKANLQANTKLLKIAQQEENDALKLKVEDAIEKDKDNITNAEDSLKKYASQGGNQTPASETSPKSDTPAARNAEEELKKYKDIDKKLRDKLSIAKKADNKEEINRIQDEIKKQSSEYLDAELKYAEATGNKDKASEIKDKIDSTETDSVEDDTQVSANDLDSKAKDFREQKLDPISKELEAARSSEPQDTNKINSLINKKEAFTTQALQLDLKAAEASGDDDKIQKAKSILQKWNDAVSVRDAKGEMHDITNNISTVKSNIKTIQDKIAEAPKDEKENLKIQLSKLENNLRELNVQFTDAKNIVNKAEGKPIEKSLSTAPNKEEAQKKLYDIEKILSDYKEKMKGMTDAPHQTPEFKAKQKAYIDGLEKKINDLKSTHESVWFDHYNLIVNEFNEFNEKYIIQINESIKEIPTNSVAENFRQLMIKNGLL